MKRAEAFAFESISITSSSISAFVAAPVPVKIAHPACVQARSIQSSSGSRAPFVSRPLEAHVPQRARVALTSLQTKMSSTPITERRRKATQLKTRVRSLTAPIPYLSHSRFNELRETDTPMVIIDAREPEEVSVSTIPSAVPTSVADEHISRMQQTHGNDFNVVCFCTVGFRSGLYAKGLVAATKNVYNYSLMEHLWGNGTLVSSQGEQQIRVHLYSRHYESYFPDKYPVEAFGGMTALFRGLGHVPGLLSAIAGKRLQTEDEPIGS
ncbi:Rhodanese-like protein [Gracilaria domingensis]|nr:Rhodanese-like protein [Gracilaria domingensis]